MLVTDEQGRGDIVEVKFELFAGGFSLGLNYYLTDPDLDSIFTFYFEPAFSAGIATGNYTFRFSAQDSLNAISYLPDDTVFIENTPPLLTDGLTDPDSVITIPDPGDTATVLVTVNVSDLQTLADIEEVFINYQRPDYLPDSLIWTFGYPMADNGLPWDLDNYLQGLPYLGDEVAGDGIFTFTKLYTSEADTGLHYFHFHCLDKTGHTADSISVELLLVKIPMGR
jgi:hypothetical protein